jgi:catechol 2,3-dioxygenase-like lactoylglutathione lyase family enzyme
MAVHSCSTDYDRSLTGRAFPAIYVRDVERSAGFYRALGFETFFRLPEEGSARDTQAP